MTLENNVISSFSFSFFLSFFLSSLFAKKQNLTLEMKSTGLRTTRMLCASIFYRPRAIVLPPFFFSYIYFTRHERARFMHRGDVQFLGEKRKKKKRKKESGKKEEERNY